MSFAHSAFGNELPAFDSLDEQVWIRGLSVAGGQLQPLQQLLFTWCDAKRERAPAWVLELLGAFWFDSTDLRGYGAGSMERILKWCGDNPAQIEALLSIRRLAASNSDIDCYLAAHGVEGW